MSHQNSLSQLFRGEDFDVRLAKVGLVLCLLLFSLRLLAEQILLVVIPVAGASACALYLVTRKQEAMELEQLTYRHEIVGYLPGFVFFGLSFLVVWSRLTGGRSLLTHLVAGAIGTLLLAQIFLLEDSRLNPGLLLGQLLIAAIVIRFSALLGNPGFIGVDIWTHVPVFVEGIVQSGSLNAIADYKYIMAPFYHLNGAIAAIVFDDARIGVYLTLGVLLAVSSLLIYTTSRLLVPARWALLATALFIFSDQFLRWGIHIIPTSLGLVFFLGALYCLTKLYYRADVRFLGLLLVFSLAVVFTHQVSTAVMLLVLGVAAVVSLWAAVRRRSTGGIPTTLRTRGLLGVFGTSLGITLVSWANTPFSDEFVFLWRMLEVLQETIVGEAGFLNLASAGDGGGGGAGGASADRTGIAAELIPAIEWFGFGLLLAMTVLGSIILLRRSDSAELKLTYLVSFAGMFTVVYGLSLFGIRTFMPGRWLAFMYAPMAIISAFGLYYVSQHASRRVMLVVIVLLACGYPTAMMVTEKATLDSPALDDDYPRFSYTDAEINAAGTIATIRSPVIESEIGTDHPYRTLYDRVGGFETGDLQIEDGEPVTSSAVVAREYQLSGPATIFDTAEPPVPRQSNSVLTESICRPTRNHIYTNELVTLCTPAGEHQ